MAHVGGVVHGGPAVVPGHPLAAALWHEHLLPATHTQSMFLSSLNSTLIKNMCRTIPTPLASNPVLCFITVYRTYLTIILKTCAVRYR